MFKITPNRFGFDEVLLLPVWWFHSQKVMSKYAVGDTVLRTAQLWFQFMPLGLSTICHRGVNCWPRWHQSPC